MEEPNWVMQQQRAPLVLQRRRVLKPQLDFRTAASRGLADFESARGDGGRPRGERGLDNNNQPPEGEKAQGTGHGTGGPVEALVVESKLGSAPLAPSEFC